MTVSRPFERQVKVSERGFDESLVELNQQNTGTNQSDSGLLINRGGGGGQDVAIYWNEMQNTFRVAFVKDFPAYGAKPDQLSVSANAPLTSGAQHVSTGGFNTDKDAQGGTYILRNQTQNNTPTELFLDGSTQRLILPDNSVWTYEVLITGKRIPSDGADAASIKITGAIARNVGAASVFLVQPPGRQPSRTYIGRTDPLWDATVAADTTNGSLQVLVTGGISKIIQWVARVTTTEIIYD